MQEITRAKNQPPPCRHHENLRRDHRRSRDHHRLLHVRRHPNSKCRGRCRKCHCRQAAPIDRYFVSVSSVTDNGEQPKVLAVPRPLIHKQFLSRRMKLTASNLSLSIKPSITRAVAFVDTTSSRTCGNRVDWYRDGPMTHLESKAVSLLHQPARFFTQPGSTDRDLPASL